MNLLKSISIDNIIVLFLLLLLFLIILQILNEKDVRKNLRIFDFTLAIFTTLLGMYLGMKIEQKIFKQSDKVAVIGLLKASRNELIQIKYSIEAIEVELKNMPISNQNLIPYNFAINLPNLFSLNVAASDPRIQYYASSDFQHRIHNHIATISLLIRNFPAQTKKLDMEKACEILKKNIEDTLNLIDNEITQMGTVYRNKSIVLSIKQ